MPFDDKILVGELSGQYDIFQRLNREIAPGDGMSISGRKHYFVVGASALSNIQEAIRTAQLSPASVKRVLDYACGYGRVLRWLIAGLPHASILGVDTNPKAVKSARETLGVETRQLDISLGTPIGGSFDLIWVGSLFTHLPRNEMLRVLYYLRDHLSAEGILIFTSHGPLVFNRLKERKRLYNLTERAVVEVISGYETTGYGFASYKGQSNYGISVISACAVISVLSELAFVPILYKAQGWAAHQDVYSCVR